MNKPLWYNLLIGNLIGLVIDQSTCSKFSLWL